MRRIILFVCLGVFSLFYQAGAQTITLASLLEEMSNRETLARFPDPAYQSLQASSYNRESTVRDAPGWFADSDGIGFIREETKNGTTEWVVMEHEGPGAITKMWAPYFHWGGLDDLEGPVINIYIDGEDKPAISENFFRFIMGRGSVPPPFAEKTARAGDCYLPIPFAKSCKVTFNKKSFYHIINYRGYPKGTAVRSFSQQQLAEALPLMDKIAEKLKMVLPGSVSNQLETAGTVLSGKPLELMAKGKAAINSIEVQLDPEQLKQHPKLLRSVILVATFDDMQTVWVPLGDFFGSANALNPFQTATRIVRSNGRLICTWLMPFKEKAVLSLKNLADIPLQVAHMSCTTIDYVWDDRSMYFHANWRSDEILPGNVFKDWNFIDIKGKGVFVGDTWTVLSADNGWWGEGDEKIYVDDAWEKKFPTHFGTGSEDYYGWAGGEAPTKDDRFSTPFLANIEVGSAIRLRAGVRGFNVLTRIRFLDAIPFNHRLVFDMEASPGTGARNPWDFNGYSVVTCWYGIPGAKDNRPPLPEAAVKPIITLAQLDSMVASARRKESGIKGAIDVQQLKYSLSSGNMNADIENISTSNAAEWNHGNHMLLSSNKSGESISFTITEQFKSATIELQLTKDPSYAVVSLYVNGKPCGKPVDLGDTKSQQPLIVPLGMHTPINNQFVIKVQVVGAAKNRNQPARAALDYFKLNPVE